MLIITCTNIHAGPVFLVNSCSECQPIYQNPLVIGYSVHRFALDFNEAMPLDNQDLNPQTLVCIRWLAIDNIQHINRFNGIDLDQIVKYSKDQKLYIYFDETINPLCKKSREIYLAWVDIQEKKHIICANPQLQGECQFPIIIPFQPLRLSIPARKM
jgi:hypothetical protein